VQLPPVQGDPENWQISRAFAVNDDDSDPLIGGLSLKCSGQPESCVVGQGSECDDPAGDATYWKPVAPEPLRQLEFADEEEELDGEVQGVLDDPLPHQPLRTVLSHRARLPGIQPVLIDSHARCCRRWS
jgi:hypothetical protein